MYNRKLWQDNVRDPARTYKATQNADGTTTLEPAGKLVQQGPNQSAENFNNMEDAIRMRRLLYRLLFSISCSSSVIMRTVSAVWNRKMMWNPVRSHSPIQ